MGQSEPLGVLAALFQPAALDGRVSLVGLRSQKQRFIQQRRVQVVATSQSADLLDREDLDLASVRSVTMERGLTVIGNVDSASREIVEKRLHTLGELMRGNQVTPDAAPSDGITEPRT